MGMGFETETAKLNALWPGLDCTINCNIPLVNVAKAFPTQKSMGVYRSKHPGAGAVSPYRSGSTHVIRDIPAGSELFKDYGDVWYEQKRAGQSRTVLCRTPRRLARKNLVLPNLFLTLFSSISLSSAMDPNLSHL
jgi:hypothetical protein